MPDNFTPMPVKGRKANDSAPDPVGDCVAVLPALVGDTATLTGGNLAALYVDATGRLRVTLDTEGGDIFGTVALDAPTRDDLVTRITTALESVDLNGPTVDALEAQQAATRAALEDVGLNVATRDDIVARLSAALEAVDLNGPTLDALEAQQAATRTALEDVGLNAATRDDLVGRLSAALEAVTVQNPLTAPAAVQLSDGAAAIATGNPLPVRVVVGAAGEAVTDSGLLTSTDVAAGANVTLAAPAATPLLEMTASASVRLKVELLAGAAVQRVFFVEANDHMVYRPSAELAGITGMRVTNMDNVLAADVYGSMTMGG